MPMRRQGQSLRASVCSKIGGSGRALSSRGGSKVFRLRRTPVARLRNISRSFRVATGNRDENLASQDRPDRATSVTPPLGSGRAPTPLIRPTRGTTMADLISLKEFRRQIETASLDEHAETLERSIHRHRAAEAETAAMDRGDATVPAAAAAPTVAASTVAAQEFERMKGFLVQLYEGT